MEATTSGRPGRASSHLRLSLASDDYAGRAVSEACRGFGVHRSTHHRWKAQVDRQRLEVLRPRERRRPKMPNRLPAMVEERIVAFAIAHPALGPRPDRERAAP